MTDQQLRLTVTEIVRSTRVTDMHTHLFPPSFGSLQMSGADHVLTYHYLIAEAFRVHTHAYDAFFDLDTKRQAEVIWDSLFVRNSPLSEAACGVLTIAKTLGADLGDLDSLRQTLQAQAGDEYVERVMDAAGVERLVMTNDPLDEREAVHWRGGVKVHPRFHAALRLDRVLNDFAGAVRQLTALGYAVCADLSGQTFDEVRRFLEDWAQVMHPVYLALSVEPTFDFPDDSVRSQLLREAVLPFCAAQRLPLALMIGVRRQVNPQLRDAGDSSGLASLVPIERLCAMYPEQRFLVTVLARENQHALAVTARKFRNLMPFGCWWFVNTGSLVDEITRMRLELLGPTFIPQHSDARVLEHLIYKWHNSRTVIAGVLADQYEALASTGLRVTDDQIQRDVTRLLDNNFWDFVQRG
ncbi:MAG: glucuronate isomerase [Firmicutes bacterium]|nr:glucuronate isomerase [Bacillota bacterium]